MKKILLVCVAVLLAATLMTPTAEAQQCLKFDAFCDGIQVDSLSGDTGAGTWYHWDCANSWPGLRIRLGIHIELPFGGVWAIIGSRAADGSPVGDWMFGLDTLDGTMDMYQGLYPNEVGWIDELAYTRTFGVCTGSPQGNGPQVSSLGIVN